MPDKSVSSFHRAAVCIKAYYQYIISAALITILILTVYSKDLFILANEALENEAVSHVLIVPFFAGILFYMRKDIVKADLALERNKRKSKTKHLDEVTGVILCLIAFLLYWYGSYTFYPLEYHILTLPIFLIGVTLILFNLKTAIALLPPILFLVLLVPIPTEYLNTLGGGMVNLNTQLSYTLLKAAGLPVMLSTAYGTPQMVLTSAQGEPSAFAVDLACSGIYSIIGFTAFAIFLALITQARLSRKLALTLIGFFIFELLNIVRLTSVVSIAYWFGEAVAMNLVHATAGLILTFVGMMLTLLVGEKLLRMQVIPAVQEQPPCPECATSQGSFCPNCGKYLNHLQKRFSPRFWTKLFLLMLSCCMVTLSINAPTFAVAKGPLGFTSSSNWENATSIFPPISGYQLEFWGRDTEYEGLAGQDASLWYRYNTTDLVVYVSVGVSGSISNLHNWEVCLISYQTAQGQYPLVNVQDSRDMTLLEDVPLIARYLVFTGPDNQTQVTLYWYERTTFNTGITVEQKYVRISLLAYAESLAMGQSYQDQLLVLGQKIATHWEPLKNQSFISLGVPAQQSLLVISVVFVFFTQTVQHSSDWKTKRNNQKIFGNFASPEEKLLLRTVQELTRNKKTFETREIIACLSLKTGRHKKPDEIRSLLNHLEEFGFVERIVVSKSNKPRLVWRVQALDVKETFKAV